MRGVSVWRIGLILISIGLSVLTGEHVPIGEHLGAEIAGVLLGIACFAGLR